MRVTARIEVNLRTAEIMQRGAGFAREFAEQIGAEAARLAKENVAVGSGPGPHPHISEHVDTGALAASVKTAPESRGFLETVRVYTDLKYGLILELGWHTKTGRFVRYPWLWVALLQAQSRADSIARSTGRRWFSETGSPYRGRVNLTGNDFATLPPFGA